MPYVNITLDVDAAISSIKFLWIKFLFRNVVTHLGDFHLMKENFPVFFPHRQYQVTCLNT